MNGQTIVYRFYDSRDSLLYVGITSRGPRRWREHMAEKPWWGEVKRVELSHHGSRLEALSEESRAIQDESPRHNIAGARREMKKTAAQNECSARADQVDGWDNSSLVGSFFHSGSDKGWQGQIVAKLTDDVYLAETYEWLLGEPWCQKVVRLEDMDDWSFYDSADWMRYQWEYGGVSSRWDRERTEQQSIGAAEVAREDRAAA